MNGDHTFSKPRLNSWLPASPRWGVEGGGEAGSKEQRGRFPEPSRANTLLTLPLDQCEKMLEEFEEVVENWYFHHQEQPLQHFLCEGHVLAASETGKCVGWSLSCQATTPPIHRANIYCFLSPNLACLQETWTGKEITEGQEKTEGEEEQDQEEEKDKEEEMTSTPGHSKHDPEDL